MSMFNNSKIKYGGGIYVQKPAASTKINYPSDKPDIEVDSEVELTELQIAFREKAKKEKELQDKNTDSEFWSMIVFKTREQRDKFCELLNIKGEDLQYINGQKLIKALELRVETMEEKTPGKFRVNADILDLSIKP